jgi:hypothetical protein
VRGRIAALTQQAVAGVDASGKPFRHEVLEVAGFTLEDAPPDLRKAEMEIGAGRFDKAVAYCQAALEQVESGKCRELNRQFVLRMLARAERARGKLDAGLKALKTLRDACGDCRLRADAYRDAVEIAREKKDPAALEAVLAEMAAEPEPLAGLATLERGKTKLAETDADGALELFRRLAAASGQPYVREARVWILRALSLQGKKEELEAACRQAAATGEEAGIALAQAANAYLAELAVERAGGAPDADKKAEAAREAATLASRALSHGPPPAGEESADHARALLAAARANLELAGRAERPEGKQHYRNRALGYFQEAARLHRGSEWAKTAEAEIAKLAPAAGGQ